MATRKPTTTKAAAKAAPKANTTSKPGPTTPRTLKEVTVKSTPLKRPSSALSGGAQVPTKRIDSLKKANPGLARNIGGGYKGSGGMTTYGPDASDAIRRGLGGSGKRK